MYDFTPERDAISAQLAVYRDAGKRMFATTSCQSSSVVLLHLLSELAPDVSVFFLNTGFHFPQTLEFKRDLSERFGLKIHDLFSSMSRSQQRATSGRLLFAADPDYCCHLNKVVPLEPVLHSHDVWINGIRAGQSAVRRAMKMEQPAAHGVLRYHPILRWDQEMMQAYIEQHDLPAHPLAAEGYRSVGCRPCTRRPPPDLDVGDERAGRWNGLRKTECGLHTTLGAASGDAGA